MAGSNHPTVKHLQSAIDDYQTTNNLPVFCLAIAPGEDISVARDVLLATTHGGRPTNHGQDFHSQILTHQWPEANDQAYRTIDTRSGRYIVNVHNTPELGLHYRKYLGPARQMSTQAIAFPIQGAVLRDPVVVVDDSGDEDYQNSDHNGGSGSEESVIEETAASRRTKRSLNKTAGDAAAQDASQDAVGKPAAKRRRADKNAAMPTTTSRKSGTSRRRAAPIPPAPVRTKAKKGKTDESPEAQLADHERETRLRDIKYHYEVQKVKDEVKHEKLEKEVAAHSASSKTKRK
ncbi:MAG: hypothetical protein Q9180_004322 [Flavoplaca navasiana]